MNRINIKFNMGIFTNFEYLNKLYVLKSELNILFFIIIYK